MRDTEGTPQNEEEKNVYQSPVRPIFDKFARHKDVTLIYGEPVSYENRCIIPVAKMSYSFGAGGGGGANTEKNESGQGEGSGGYISVKPLGVYEMGADRVRFKPVIDVKFILTAVSVLTAVVTLRLWKK